MPSSDIITTGTISCSGLTVLLCLGGLIGVYNNLQEIWIELDNEMDLFRLQAHDLWNDMLQMGAGTPSNRQRRQAYTAGMAGNYQGGGGANYQPTSTNGGYQGGGGPTGPGPNEIIPPQKVTSSASNVGGCGNPFIPSENLNSVHSFLKCTDLNLVCKAENTCPPGMFVYSFSI